MTIANNTERQTLDVPVTVESRITLLEDVDIDSSEGSMSSIIFEGYVEQYVPQTNKLSFENSDIGYSEFHEMLEQADGVEIITD